MFRSESSDVVVRDYYYSASSAEGAVGDIVATDVTLTLDVWRGDAFGLALVLSYDPAKLEAVGQPLFSEEYDRLVYWAQATWLTGKVGPKHVRGELGFGISAALVRQARQEMLQAGARLPLVTFFFRIVGEPGEVAEIRFSDGEWAFPSGVCAESGLDVPNPGGVVPQSFFLRSERHQSGLVRILPGEPTRTEIPELPPRAKVYPEETSPETTRILFKLSGGVACP